MLVVTKQRKLNPTPDLTTLPVYVNTPWRLDIICSIVILCSRRKQRICFKKVLVNNDKSTKSILIKFGNRL